MAIDFITKHPKLVFLLIGLVLIIPAVWGTSTMYDKLIEEKTVRIEELASKLTQREATISTLLEYNKKLSQKVKTVKIVKPDGTVHEVTESDTNSETQITKQVQEQYKETIQEEISKVREELSRVTTINRKLNLEAGMTLDMNYYVHGSYNVWSVFTIGAGMTFPDNSYLFGIGINL